MITFYSHGSASVYQYHGFCRTLYVSVADGWLFSRFAGSGSTVSYPEEQQCIGRPVSVCVRVCECVCVCVSVCELSV